MRNNPQYIDKIGPWAGETAPLTDEQWDRFIGWYSLTRGPIAGPIWKQTLETARAFSSGIEQLQQMAGHTQTDIASLASAIGELARVDDESEQGE